MEWSGRVAALVFARRPGGGGSVPRLPADRPPRGPGRRRRVLRPRPRPSNPLTRLRRRSRDRTRWPDHLPHPGRLGTSRVLADLQAHRRYDRLLGGPTCRPTGSYLYSTRSPPYLDPPNPVSGAATPTTTWTPAAGAMPAISSADRATLASAVATTTMTPSTT